MPKDSIQELLEKLTKEELLSLIKRKHFYINKYDIFWSQIDVCEKKAGQYFKEWKEFELPEYGRDLEEHIAYLKAQKERSEIWKKYERQHRKIDQLYLKVDRKRCNAN